MNPLQLQILKLLSTNEFTEKDLVGIKQLIIQSLSQNIDNAVNNLFETNNWDEKKIQEWGKKHLRSYYLK